MTVATAYMIEFSDEAALKAISEYYQNHGKTACPEAEALIFVQISSMTGMVIAMWPSDEIREKGVLAKRVAFTERFGASIKENVSYRGEVLVNQIKYILLMQKF